MNDPAQRSRATDESTPLSATGVKHSFGDVTVLVDVSMDVPAGRSTALIGPNGSGKTTLIQALCGLLRADGGRIDRPDDETDRAIGYLPQRPAFRSGFTVRETITFYQRLVGEADVDPTDRLERVGLSEVGDRPVEGLSGGMKRLLGIAQATVGDPPVIVLDEPTSGLDPGAKEAVFEIVSTLPSDGTAVLFSSHDLDGVERYADRVALLADGTVQFEASVETIRADLDVSSLFEAYRTAVDEALFDLEEDRP